MTTQPCTLTELKGSPGNLQQQVRARIDSLSYLPTTASVAIKLVELSKDPEAGTDDYAKVVGADTALSGKLLGLANSSWAGVRSKVTTTRMAVNLLGLGAVRTLATSYCMTGLHNELQLSPAESQVFWESALCKAVAAKKHAGKLDEKLAEEAFVAGLFQDLALTVMYSVARQPYLELLQNPGLSGQAQLQEERELFGMDHSEVGRVLAQKMELPQLFVDTVAFHHNYKRLEEFVGRAVLRDATYAAGLLPHALNTWNKQDAEGLAAFLQEHAPSVEMATYLAEVEAEFAQLYAFFHEGKAPEGRLTEVLAETAREVADNTTALVGTVNQLVQEAATMGMEASDKFKKLEAKANCDQLTGVLNREGFTHDARESLADAARYETSISLCYLDIDRFKAINDGYGHAFGDHVLQTIIAEMSTALPGGTLIGRMGGDEFVIMLNSCTREDARQAVERLIANVAAKPVCKDELSAQISLSGGLLHLEPSDQTRSLDELIDAADKLMYRAKRAGGNRVELETV